MPDVSRGSPRRFVGQRTPATGGEKASALWPEPAAWLTDCFGFPLTAGRPIESHGLVAAIAEDFHSVGGKEDADWVATMGALWADIDLLDLLGHLQCQGDADAQRDEPSDEPHNVFLLHTSAAAPVVSQR